MESVSVVRGALRYEFGMQLRRGSVWVVLALVSTLPIALWFGLAGSVLHAHYSPELHKLRWCWRTGWPVTAAPMWMRSSTPCRAG